MKNLIRSAVCAGLLAVSSFASAELQVQTFSIYATGGDSSSTWQDTVYVNKFAGNPLSLKNVIVTLTTGFGNSVFTTRYDARAVDPGVNGTVTSRYTLESSVWSSSADITSLTPASTDLLTTEVQDVVAYGAPVQHLLSDTSTPAIYDVAANAVSAADLAAALSLFQGPGTFDLTLWGQFDNPSKSYVGVVFTDVAVSLENHSNVTVSVAYDFTLVPEPAGLALLGIALAGAVAGSRFRKNIV